MLTLRCANSRGQSDLGWLDSRHTFSFADFHDPQYMGFGVLRVINEDRVAPGKGFGPHPHREMEIVSYVLAGALEHKDSLGTGSIIAPGDVQRMSAGTGVRHSEFNHSPIDPVHFLQIWIVPERRGLEPSYEQVSVADADKQGRLHLVGSRDGRQGSVTIHQDLSLYASRLSVNDGIEHSLAAQRQAWLQMVRGTAQVNGELLSGGDGLAIEDVDSVSVTSTAEDTELLLFDMAAT